jgi:RNA polymerase sigma factor (TIGR02999 family)
MGGPPGITELLIDWNNGSAEALQKLMPMVETELRRIAANHMRRERPGHTLQTSALVNEAYLKLIDQRQVRWENRSHFFALASQLMRRILLDHARAQGRAKRGGDAVHVGLDEVTVISPQKSETLIALDEALTRLGKVRLSKCVSSAASPSTRSLKFSVSLPSPSCCIGGWPKPGCRKKCAPRCFRKAE